MSDAAVGAALVAALVSQDMPPRKAQVPLARWGSGRYSLVGAALTCWRERMRIAQSILGTVVGLSLALSAAAELAGCAASGSLVEDSDAGDGGNGFAKSDAAVIGAADTAAPTEVRIYANTDRELYVLDPQTKLVSLVGTFESTDKDLSSVTDLAVDENDVIWVNTATTLYRVSSVSAGKVQLEQVAALPKDTIFYALALTPKGTLESDESLIGGDGDGAVWYLSKTGGTARKLGGFGTVKSGDPAPSGSNVWTLSGDMLFYKDGSNARGLATLRACKSGKNGDVTDCDFANDVLAEIDMAALKEAYTTKSTRNLRKQILGAGTGYGRLFGIGAWGDKVYAFGRNSTQAPVVPAQLIEVSGNGDGVALQAFDKIDRGWSGAGVTTRAVIQVVR